MATPHASARAVGLLAPLAAGAVYLPPAGAALMLLLLLAVLPATLGREHVAALKTTGSWALLLVAWMALSALWSPASWPEIASHGWHFVGLLLVPLFAATIPAQTAQRALSVFMLATAAFALLQIAHPWFPIAVDSPLSSMVHYQGNKGISNSVLAALGAALAVDAALRSELAVLRRAALLAGAFMVFGVVVASSSARTALVASLVLGGALAVLRLRHWWQWLLFALVIALAAGAVATGRSGLAARSEAQLLSTSNSQRLALYGETLRMIEERPLLGHGLGSWPGLWAARNTDAAMRTFNTAHQEWLQITQQGGLVALVLWLGALLQWARAAWAQRSSRAGSAALLALLAWVTTATFNAAIRDAAFALPMALMLGMALAAGRER